MQQTSLVEHVCAASIGRLLITDRLTSQQFLVDTGSDLLVYPRRLIPRRMEWVSYDLYAADGSLQTCECATIAVCVDGGTSWHEIQQDWSSGIPEDPEHELPDG
jgi:hypothetical protein